MARQNISVGSAANDGTGDSLRTAGIKINSNFIEVYNITGNLSPVAVSGSYNDLIAKPTIATDLNELTDSQGLLTNIGTFYGSVIADSLLPENDTAYDIGSSSLRLRAVYAQDIPGYISLTELQSVVADSADFTDFQTRIAAL